jgi:hypothetical protein
VEALVALARQADEDVHAFIRERASVDPHPDERVRAAALRVLGDKMRHDIRFGGPPDGDIEELLRDRSVADDRPDVRKAAAQALTGDDDTDWDDEGGDEPET